MHFSTTRVTIARSLGLVLLLSSVTAAEAALSGCVSVNLDVLIRESKLVKRAQMRLVDEFVQDKSRLDKLNLQVLEAEFALHTVQENSADREGIQQKTTELEGLRSKLASDQKAYDTRLQQRKSEVLDGLVHQASVAYQSVGTIKSYAKLFQEGGSEPIFPPLPGAEDFVCNEKRDVTREVLSEMDKGL